MKHHELKTVQPYFDLVAAGIKDFEIRNNDRNFQSGDLLKLYEFPYSGRYLLRRVKYVFHGSNYGLKDNFVILGLENYQRKFLMDY